MAIVEVKHKTGIYQVLIDDADLSLIEGWEIRVVPHDKGKRWYAQLVKYDGIIYSTAILHRFLTGCAKKRVDHIDRNTLNNQRENLRICTAKQNSHNVGPHKLIYKDINYKGVRWLKDSELWYVSIIYNGKNINLGRYIDPVKAARVYDTAARHVHGKFAYLNFPDILEPIYFQARYNCRNNKLRNEIYALPLEG